MANWNKGIEKLSNKRVFVLGAARSGIAAAHLLLRLGAKVVLNDVNEPKPEDNWVEELQAKGVEVIVGSHPEGLLDDRFDLVVKNPGIPYRHPYLCKAVELGIPIVTEIELGSYILEGLLIGITGSNGKTTTTTLVGEFFRTANRDTIVAGNIGHVFSEQVQTSKPNTVIVTELSSFQLKGTKEFAPHIACLLNVFHHHLDYHETFTDYVDSKAKIFQNQQKSDYAVLNWDNEVVRSIAPSVRSQVYWFSTREAVERGAFVDPNGFDGDHQPWIYFKGAANVAEAILPLAEIALVGAHNLENVLASVAISMLGGVDKTTIREVLQRFGGVEHRLEFVAEKNGIRYYNDSKATNPEATEKAIQSFQDPIVLIVGGLERGEELEVLLPLLQASVHTLIAYGETKERFYELGKAAGLAHVEKVQDVTEATKLAAKLAKQGDVVLLSPACASWDLYTSFEERGRMFKEAVHTL